MKFVMLCSNRYELFVSWLSLKTTERRFPVMLLNTYLANCVNHKSSNSYADSVCISQILKGFNLL